MNFSSGCSCGGGLVSSIAGAGDAVDMSESVRSKNKTTFRIIMKLILYL